jgi:hypothetical protein
LEVENKMEITETKMCATAALAAVGFIAILALSFATVPQVLAASAGSNYPIELIRAHTDFKVVDPAPALSIGVGVHGDR